MGMTKIDFKDRTEQVEIADKTYNICVSNYDFIKKVQNSIKDLEAAQVALNANSNIDELVKALETFINFTLEDDFDRIWEAANKDIFNMLDIANVVSGIINKGFEYKVSKYV